MYTDPTDTWSSQPFNHLEKYLFRLDPVYECYDNYFCIIYGGADIEYIIYNEAKKCILCHSMQWYDYAHKANSLTSSQPFFHYNWLHTIVIKLLLCDSQYLYQAHERWLDLISTRQIDRVKGNYVSALSLLNDDVEWIITHPNDSPSRNITKV